MSLGDWLASFRDLHERARRGTLDARSEALYRAGREELARAMLAAQRLTVKPGETPRQALRVARALQVDLDFATSAQRAMTLDLSTGGFSCPLTKAPPLGDEVKFSLRLPAAEPVSGRCRVQDVKVFPANVRVSFQFLGLPEKERERLEMFVFDAVLASLQQR